MVVESVITFDRSEMEIEEEIISNVLFRKWR
jgi:hypothetical protein